MELRREGTSLESLKIQETLGVDLRVSEIYCDPR